MSNKKISREDAKKACIAAYNNAMSSGKYGADLAAYMFGRYVTEKQYFNVLLDDRAGLESAYNNLKYVLDYAENNQLNKT